MLNTGESGWVDSLRPLFSQPCQTPTTTVGTHLAGQQPRLAPAFPTSLQGARNSRDSTDAPQPQGSTREKSNVQNPSQQAALTRSVRARNEFTCELWNHLLFNREATAVTQKSCCEATRGGK